MSFFHPPLLRWMRKAHGWVGLWGAALGLVFGFSGFWLNHRALLKLPVPLQQRQQVQLTLPDTPPANAEEMARWLQAVLELPAPPTTVRTDPARPVAWSDRKAEERGHDDPKGAGPRNASAKDAGSKDAASRDAEPSAWMQPERWVFNFGGPFTIVQAEYWKGNRSVAVSTTRNGPIGTLTGLHKGVGMDAAWILLVDTLAGSLIVLTLSGAYLWMGTHRRRTLGWVVLGAPVAAIVGLALR